MRLFRADLHTHTVLSPCGDLEMSPKNIIAEAKKREIDIIGITDHNSTKNSRVAKEIGEEHGVFVLCGAEVTTNEEIHVLTFFEDFEKLNCFQKYLDEYLIPIKNDVQKFGYQVIVDNEDVILGYEDKLLINALDRNIYQIEKRVHELEGILILAHIDRSRNSIIGQIGFIPDDLKVDAIELSKYVNKIDYVKQNNYLSKYPIVQSSDAHYTKDIASVHTVFEIDKPSFKEIKLALQSSKSRKILTT